jgi:hypothetical protein
VTGTAGNSAGLRRPLRHAFRSLMSPFMRP